MIEKRHHLKPWEFRAPRGQRSNVDIAMCLLDFLADLGVAAAHEDEIHDDDIRAFVDRVQHGN